MQKTEKPNLVKFWFDNSRPTALPQSVLPCILAIFMAGSMSGFSIWLSLLALIGVIAGHSGLNLFDDYFDYTKKKSEYRDELVHEGFRARILKCPYLTSGQATVRQLLIACIVFSGIALLCGGIILYFRGITILYIAIITGILGVFYSAPPLRLSYHGMGEILIFLIFGPLNMIGTYYAACGVIDNAIIFISIPVGLLVMNIVYTHSILDFIPDKKIGKKTLAVIMNNTTAMLAVLFIINLLPYGIVTYGIIAGYLSNYYWLVFLIFPMAVSLCYLMVMYIKDPQRKFKPRFWMGPMNGWERIVQFDLDWFMIRWLSARNQLSFFCLVIIIISVISYFLK